MQHRLNTLRAFAEHEPAPQYFQPPTSGTGPNNLPYLNWFEAAAQLTRAGASWTGSFGQPATVSYAFRASGSVPSGAGISGFAQFNAAQITAAEEALRFWSEVANITFVRVGSGTTGPQAYSNNATMLFANFINGPPQFSAFAYLPDPAFMAPGDAEGDLWFNVSRDYDADPLTFPLGARILLHEIGHTLGFLHPSVYDGGANSGVTYAADADYAQDTHQYTVQSYFAETNTGAYFGGAGITPMMHDIAAAQLIYGANMTTRTGNTTYGFNSNAGHAAFSITSAAGMPVFCIWDAGGLDTLDLSGFTTASEIDLREESFSSAGRDGVGTPLIGNISIARGAIIENAIGGSGADTIIGNDVANTLTGNNGADILNGNGGADTLIGGAGADQLLGGEGNDTIYWDAADNLANVLGGNGTDLLIFTSGAAPTTFNLGTHGFEAAEGRFTDTGGNPWATQTFAYDALWRLDTAVQINDNGVREGTDYDQASTQIWSTNFTREDALGRLDVSVLTYDDGSRAVNDYDQASAFNWLTDWHSEDTLARVDVGVLTYDDGSRAVNDYDQASAFNWVTDWHSEDALARVDTQVITYDDGTRAVNDYDQGDAFDWVTDWHTEDALGRVDVSVLTFDDGRYAVQDYDQADDFGWATMWWLYDENGALLSFVGTNDDGSHF